MNNREMTEREYQEKKLQVIAKFQEEFVKGNYNTDHVFRTIIELLIRGSNPYIIIEQLINDRKEIMAKLHELAGDDNLKRYLLNRL